MAAAPTIAPARPDEAVAVAHSAGGTWSVKLPGREWVVLPAQRGHDVLAAVQRAPGSSGYTVWRTVQSGDTLGISKVAVGRPGQPVSGRLAAVMGRMGVLHPPTAVQAGVVAPAGAPAAVEAPVQVQLHPVEIQTVGTSGPSAVLHDGEPITEEDAPSPGGAMVATTEAGMTPTAGQPPAILGIPLRSLLILGALGFGGWKLWRKYGGRGNPSRRRSNHRYEDDDDDDDDEDDDED